MMSCITPLEAESIAEAYIYVYPGLEGHRQLDRSDEHLKLPMQKSSVEVMVRPLAL